MEIPQKGQFIQRNRGDSIGNVQGTFNIDWTAILGKTRVTRMIKTTSGLLGVPCAFKYYAGSFGTNGIYTIAGTKLYISIAAGPNGVFALDVQTGTPITCDSNYSDLEIFNGYVYATAPVSGHGILYKLNTTWSALGTNLVSAVNSHMLCTYGQRLYISNGTGVIYSIDTSDTFATSGTNTVDTTAYGYVTCMRASSNRIWICILATSGKGYVLEWDGVSTQITKAYRLESQGALACVIKDDIPWITDVNGRVFTFSNSTFDEIGRLPLDEKFLVNATATTNNRFIHPNGMTVSKSKINLLINNVVNDSASSIPEFCPSGIWEYDDIIYDPYTGTSIGSGLYHKYSMSYLPVGTNTITDYGQNRVSLAGALSDMKLGDNAAAATGNLIAGATIYTDATNTSAAIFTNDTFIAVSGTTGQYNTQGAGYIVTTKIPSSEILDAWNKIYMFYRQFLNATDMLVGKVRITDAIAQEVTITWVDTQTCTTTSNILGKEKYEFEVTQGTGGGKTVHIKTIDYNGSVYTIHLDDTFTGVSTGTAKARIQNWIKIGSVTDQTSQQKPLKITAPIKASTWIQIKVCFIFAGIGEFTKMNLITNPQQAVE